MSFVPASSNRDLWVFLGGVVLAAFALRWWKSREQPSGDGDDPGTDPGDDGSTSADDAHPGAIG